MGICGAGVEHAVHAQLKAVYLAISRVC